MHAIILADEDVFTTAAWAAEVNARLDGVSPDDRTICFAGSQDFLEVAADTVGAKHLEYLGPVVADYSPLWWWGWMLAVRKNVFRDCVLVGALNGSAARPEVVSVFASKTNDVLHLWAQLVDSQGEAAARLAMELAAALRGKPYPPAARLIVRHMTTYFRAYAAYWERFLFVPNPISWADIAGGSLLGRRVTIDVSQSVKDLQAAISDLTAVGVACPPFPPPVLGKVTDHVPPHAPQAADLVDRGRVWSGLLYGRAELLRSEGRRVEAFANVWRSLEAYATSVGITTRVLDIDRAHGYRVCWGAVATSYGDVTAKKLFDELLARGILISSVPSVSHLSFDHIRDLRNDSIYGHGYLGIEAALLDDVMKFVAEVIQAREAASKLWEASRQAAFSKFALVEVPLALADAL